MYYNHKIGKQGEDLGVRHLQNKGFEIIERNFLTRWGEIDILAKKNNTIYFFEVKTRYSSHHGHPFEAISNKKIRRIKRAGLAYISQKKMNNIALAVGVIGIIINKSNKQASIKMVENIGW